MIFCSRSNMQLGRLCGEFVKSAFFESDVPSMMSDEAAVHYIVKDEPGHVAELLHGLRNLWDAHV